jgi:CRP-like cAMP-binding protein
MITDCGNCPLRRQPLFSPFADTDLDFMRRFKTDERQVGPGTEILSHGEDSPHLFTVLRGFGLRHKTLQNGRRQVLSFVMPGDFLGLQTGVMGEMQHSVQATTHMTLCVFDRTDLWQVFTTRPELAFDLTWLAAMEEHVLGEALSVVGQLPAIEQVAWALKRYHEKARGVGLERDGRAPFPFRQQDLADALGLSLVHTNKTLRQLLERQLLVLMEGQLRLLDAKRIETLVEMGVETPGRRPLI